MKWIEEHPVASLVCFALSLIGLTVGAWISSSYFEARAYNRVTGAHVSTFDAMFIELRVQEGPK